MNSLRSTCSIDGQTKRESVLTGEIMEIKDERLEIKDHSSVSEHDLEEPDEIEELAFGDSEEERERDDDDDITVTIYERDEEEEEKEEEIEKETIEEKKDEESPYTSKKGGSVTVSNISTTHLFLVEGSRWMTSI